ncbi:hypothetical protein [Actinomadura alba]|uniref:Uncharacterized protein n=1 Tax=Actinomadura alba TaxID=406431 RepID=A0ABR7LSY0_9ACTN|nr:hypothetical protein [Actinomadura alba]MBC6467956.1 hypothetical protein [Actinomadura alba]
MKTVEEQLRDALRSRAETFTSDPAAIVHVRRRVRRRRRRIAIGVIVPAAIAAAGIVPAATLMKGTGESGGGTVTAARPTPEAPRGNRPTLEEELKRHPPTSEIGVLTPSGRASGARLRAWFTDLEHGPGACIQQLDRSGAVSGGGCNPISRKYPTTLLWWRAQVDAEKPVSAYVGYADDRVASVTAELADGRRYPGSLLRAKGYLCQIWQVGTPMGKTVRSIVFKDERGAVVRRIRPPRSM